jgi:hypothetical protein
MPWKRHQRSRFWPTAALCFALGFLPAARAQSPATVRSIGVLNGGDFELEIEATQPITPATQVVTNPDRLVIDIPNAVPGRSLHPILVNTAAVKSIRIGLFQANPPISRIVVDLKSPQAYQVFPSGKSVIIKISTHGGSGRQVASLMQTVAKPRAAAPIAASVPAASVPAASVPAASPVPVSPSLPPAPRVQVSFARNQLQIAADRAPLADVLQAVRQQMGINISFPPGSGQEPVSVNLGPGPARQVLSALLDGSRYNILLVGSGRDFSAVSSIILTPRGASGSNTAAQMAPPAASQAGGVMPQPEPAPPEPQQVDPQEPPQAEPPPPEPDNSQPPPPVSDVPPPQ